jgi:hypothetical protein
MFFKLVNNLEDNQIYFDDATSWFDFVRGKDWRNWFDAIVRSNQIQRNLKQRACELSLMRCKLLNSFCFHPKRSREERNLHTWKKSCRRNMKQTERNKEKDFTVFSQELFWDGGEEKKAIRRMMGMEEGKKSKTTYLVHRTKKTPSLLRQSAFPPLISIEKDQIRCREENILLDCLPDLLLL